MEKTHGRTSLPKINILISFAIALAFCSAHSLLAEPRNQSATDVAIPDIPVDVYKHASGHGLQIYRFEPAGHEPLTEQRPAAVFFFGGGWNGGSVRQFEKHAKYLASRGMVIFLADYRVKKKHGTNPDACVQDGKSARASADSHNHHILRHLHEYNRHQLPAASDL